MEFFSTELRKTRAAKKYGKMATKTKEAVLQTFWNEAKGSFYDFIREIFFRIKAGKKKTQNSNQSKK